MAYRLDAASEETLLTLVGQDESRRTRDRRRLLLQARKENGGAVLEFIAAVGEENVQDRIGLLAERPDDSLVSRKCPCGCCAISRPPFATSSSTIRTS